MKQTCVHAAVLLLAFFGGNANAQVWKGACTQGSPRTGWSGIGEGRKYSVAACTGKFSSGDSVSSSNPAAICNKDAGFRVCTGTDMVKSALTHRQGRSFSGCFVYNAANDCHGCFDTCTSRGASVNGASGCADRFGGHDIAGIGSSCNNRGAGERACVAGGRINGNNHGNGKCQMGRSSGVVCCSTRTGPTTTATTTTKTKTTTTTVSTTTTSTTTTTTTTTSTTTTTTMTTTTTTTTTLKECGPGEYLYMSSWSPPKCSACGYGTFRADVAHSEFECLPWKDCDDHEHVLERASSTQNNLCETTEECADGEYEYRAPIKGKRNRQCKPITECVAGQYINRPATATSDRRCRRCDRSAASYATGMCTTTTRTTTSASSTTKTRTTKTRTTYTRSTTTRSTTTTATTTTATDSTTTTSTLRWSLADYLKLDADALGAIGKRAEDLMGDEIGFTPQQLSDAGFFADEIAAAASVLGAYSPSDMKDVDGMTVQLLKYNDYDANDVRAAGYTQKEMVDGGYSSAEIAASAAYATSASTESKNSASATTTTVIVVVVIFIILFAVAAFIYVQQGKGNDDTGVVAFSNPLYDDSGPKMNNGSVDLGTSGTGVAFASFDDAYNEPAYMDLPGASESTATAGYMDVAPEKMGGPTDVAYMDVAPGASAASGYMDVAPGASAASGYMDVAGHQQSTGSEAYMDVAPGSEASEEEI